MPAARIDQLYCTYCTYRTSALHRREGVAGDQVFEESVRAGSVPRDGCHDLYVRLSGYLAFHAPGDMPADVMLQHTAQTLPQRRMIYLPTTNGYRLVAQMCFRQTDPHGRPGAYFGHVLIQDAKELPAWSALDCLRLWGSKSWMIEDRVNLPFDLPSLKELKEFDSAENSSINDLVLRSFLTAPTSSGFRDRGVIIPERWRQESPQARQKLVVNLLQAVLNLDFDRREQLLIVVEPSLAALLFYAIFRLLPPTGIAEKLSFSTYESHRDRPVTTLAATCFHDPVASDLSSDWYSAQTRGAAYNTFKTDAFTPLKKIGQYAASVVAMFLNDGSTAVDKFRTTCGQLGLGKPEDLERLSSVYGLATELLVPKSNEQLAQLEKRLPKEPPLRAFLRRKLAESLIADSEADLLAKLFTNPGQALAVLRLLTELNPADADRELEPAVQLIVVRWPDSAVGMLLNDKGIPKERKATLLKNYVAAHRVLPPDAEALFFSRGSVCSRDRILTELLRTLQGDQLRRLVEQTYGSLSNPACFCELLRALGPWVPSSPDHARVFQGLFSHLRLRINPEEETQMLSAVLADKGLRERLTKLEFFECEPISAHLRGILDSLIRSPALLSEQVALLDEFKRWIPDCNDRLATWQAVAAQLNVLQQLNEQPRNAFSQILGGRASAAQDDAAKALAFAAKQVLPQPGDPLQDQRVDEVYRLAVGVVGEEGLPTRFRAALESVFLTDVWPDRQKGAEAVNPFVKTGAIIAVAVLIVIGLGFVSARFLRPFKSSSQLAQGDDNRKSETVAETENAVPPSTVDSPEAVVPKKSPKPPVVVAEKAISDKSVTRAVAKPALAPKASVQPITWSPHYNIPTPKLDRDAPKLSDDEDPIQNTTTLQSWKAADGDNSSPEEVKRFLKDVADIQLIGINELNEYLERPRDEDLDKGLRVFAEPTTAIPGNGTRSLRVFKSNATELAARTTGGGPKTLLRRSDQLCSFEIDELGVHFGWASTANPIRLKLQQLLCYCWLEIQHPSRADRTHIPLLTFDSPFFINPRSASNSETKMVDGQEVRIISTPPWMMNFPRSIPYGFDAFDWTISKVRITDNVSGNEPYEAMFGDPDETLSSTARVDTKHIPPGADSLELRTNRSQDPSDDKPQFHLVMTASVLLKKDLPRLEAQKAGLKSLLNQVLFNPDRPYRDAKAGEIDFNSSTEQPLNKKKLSGNFRPLGWVAEMTKRLQECDSEIAIRAAPSTPFDFELTAQTTMDQLQRMKANAFLRNQITNYLESYSEWADESMIRPACVQYLKLSEEVKTGAGGSNPFEIQVRSYCETLRTVEVIEFSRKFNGKWIAVPLRTRGAARTRKTD